MSVPFNIPEPQKQAGTPGAVNRTLTPRRHNGPRKVRGGLKLQGVLSQDAAAIQPSRTRTSGDASAPGIPGAALAMQLLSLMHAKFLPEAWAQGTEYAKAGQIVSLEIQSGRIEANVQGSFAKPYQTSLALQTFDEDQWERVTAAMAEEAVHVAKLLSGEWPVQLQERLDSAGLPLIPADPDAFTIACTCHTANIETQGCKHAAALVQVAAEALAMMPQRLFTFRGRTADSLLHDLRMMRRVATPVSAVSHRDSSLRVVMNPPPALPLEETLEEFWRRPERVNESQDGSVHEPAPTPVHAPHALLRRLGPSPLNGRFPMVGLLASVYDAVAAQAKRLRDGEPV